MIKVRHFLHVLLLAACVFAVGAVSAQSDTPPPAEIINDEGGAVVVRGQMIYTNPLLTAGIAQPLIILEDQTGFVQRDKQYLFPQESQTLGQFTSDFFTSPVSYSIALPIEPQGALNDVDNDDDEDAGVQIFAIAFWSNTYGDPFLERRDQGGGGWSTAYASTAVDSATSEVEGGKLLIYAPEEGQGFPSGFGEDGLLFTDDDPIVIVPQGYTVVDLNSDPFTFDRSRVANIDTIEPEQSALDDFSSLSYTEAFDAMVEKFRTEYAFTEYKGLDWNALSDEFRPLVVEAQANRDGRAFALAIEGFANSIPDGHVSANSAFLNSIPPAAGGLGLGLRELDDGRVIAVYVGADTPASAAGIQLAAEITTLNGEPIDDAISALPGLNPPYGSPVLRRLDQVRQVTRFEVGEDVELTFINPGDDAAQTVTLTAIAESASRLFTRDYVYGVGQAPNVPVQFEFLDSGYGYVKINSFFENEVLTVQIWETFLSIVNQYGVPGIIIDMRQNGGGSGFLADQLAGYFFEEDQIVGYTSYYDPDTDTFVTDLERPDRMYAAPAALRYSGAIAVLVGPSCASACEFFSYNMTVNDRAQIVGHYPTAGLGGSVQDFYMPEGIAIRFTIGRALDANQEIHLEGIGVVPTIDVPIDEETAFASGDVVLDYAVRALDEATGQVGTSRAPAQVEIVEGGEIAVGDEVEGSLAVGQRVRYTLTVEDALALDITVAGVDGDLDTYLRIFDSADALITENDDVVLGQEVNSAVLGLTLDAGETIIIEVGTYDDSSAGDFVLKLTPAE